MHLIGAVFGCGGCEKDVAEQLEVLEKFGLPPGREHGVPLPVTTGGGGGFDGDECVHGHLLGLSEPMNLQERGGSRKTQIYQSGRYFFKSNSSVSSSSSSFPKSDSS